MNRDYIQKLIGGYATGSLSEEERRELFDAALEDQELFDALQREQPLKELLDDPVSRAAVRAAVVGDLSQPMNADERRWGRGWVWALGGCFAVAAVLLVVMLRPDRRAPLPTQVAAVRQQSAPAPVPVPQPGAEPSRQPQR